MPERGPRFKDMKVYPEPDDLPLPHTPHTPSGTALGNRYGSPILASPREEKRLLATPKPFRQVGAASRQTERLTPKARLQLLEVEDLEQTDEGVRSRRGSRRSSEERNTIISTGRNSVGEVQIPSGKLVMRPSDEFLNGGQNGRKAVHAGETGGFLAAQISKENQAKLVKEIGGFVDGRFMTATSVALTVYALIGDDVRVLCTNRPADPWFNAMALITLLFFTVEIGLSSIGKPDYFLGFFFFLDLVATFSILLDLTWISEPLMSSQNLNAGDSARSGRTARIGATVGRVVRVLRLMRIVKLYRAYFEKMTRKVTQQPPQVTQLLAPGLSYDDWDNEEEWEEAELAHERTTGESAVGRKLVSLTTRRVICMVLVMLLVLPYLRLDMSEVNSTSASWGADSVWESFRRLEQNASLRGEYEDTLLQFLYFHNWFQASTVCGSAACPNDFWMHPFWVGFAGGDIGKLRQKAQLALVTEQALGRWDSLASDPSLLYFTGTMPRQASLLLTRPWGQECTFGGVPHFGVSLLSSKIQGHVDHVAGCPTDLRPGETARVHPMLLTQAQFDDWHIVFFFDMRPFVREESFLAVLATAFICVILLVSTLFFSRDANNLVLKPVERMVEKVKTIANDPLIALKMADAEFELEEFLKYKSTKPKKASWWLLDKWNNFVQAISPPSSSHQSMETAILEKTIIKLGSLLALGFGEAGANIVSSNMRGLDSSGVNAMIPGSRVDCIIGQARICDFSLATEVLQGKVMKFVNQIAEVVHGIVNEYQGAPNKNTGDTFLLIWRIDGLDEELQTRLGDLSIISFARILAAVHESPLLASYRAHPGLQQRLGSRFRVNLSFGLHRGWAIEGAVGSEFKIDASYLSPNVSMTASIEQATRIYGVSLLIAETVFQQCSPSLAQKCRLVDRVIIKGSVEPLDLYALDLDFSALQVSTRDRIDWNTRQRFRARQMLEMEKRERLALDVDVTMQLFDFCPQIVAMRERYTEDFLQFFKMGFRNYEEGEWQAARRFLSRTLEMIGIQDGPSGYLLHYMGTGYDFEAPANWRGMHALETERAQRAGVT